MTDQAQIVDGDGEVVAAFPADQLSDADDDVEISRENLCLILLASVPAQVRLVFDDSISSLVEDADSVTVSFDSGPRANYDLVVGADGLHSVVRRLAFGPERDYLLFLGVYVAITKLPAAPEAGRLSMMYNFPGHSVSVVTDDRNALGVFVFRSEQIDYDYHDTAEQRRILTNAYATDRSWRIPELIAAAQTDEELYFDSASQVHMPAWSRPRSRIVLIGDAAHSAAFLSGRGSSLALSGAWFLAEALREHPTDLAAAFAAYEERQRPYVRHAQHSIGPGKDLIVPDSWAAIRERNNQIREAAASARG